ncbi:hypothetical protein BWR19_02830 [Halomonas sp. 1513]|nr:nucleotide-binding protein [Halomonas sp. 1513]APX91966.1 hypothetical protein BWR19_02830 [Halomonas sp. 1513]
MNRKPRIFIGSSSESLDVADAVNLNLDHKAEVTIWRNGTFDLSSNTIDALTKKAKAVDFSLFIFSPDDIAIIRSKQKAIVRDNVLFELGLFIGALGKERCFILKPRGVDLHFPTDLLGVTPADYESNRSDGDLASSVNHACVLMKQQMEKLRTVEHVSTGAAPPKINIEAAKIKDFDYLVLAQLLGTATSDPEGHMLFQLKNNLNEQSYKVDLAIIRLERVGYIEKRNDSDINGNEFYTYKITPEGIELLFENEELAFPAQKSQLALPRKAEDYFDDDIPF